jgi:Zn ribbon nucleic-acid-binding protein
MSPFAVLRVLCPSCQQLHPLEQFSVEPGDVLRVTCIACGHVAMVSASPVKPAGTSKLASVGGVTNLVEWKSISAWRQAQSFSTQVPSTHCPKCVAQRHGGTTCHACGLDFSRAEEGQFQPSDELRDAWRQVVEHWTTPSHHEQIRGQAQETGALPALARLYRIVLAREPNEPIAMRALAALTSQAQIPLLLGKANTEVQNTQRIKLVWALLLFAASIAMAVFTLYVLGRP